MPEVAAKLVESLFAEGGEPAAPGSFKFYRHSDSDESAGLHFICPCGCGSVLGVAFRNPAGQSGPQWSWDGNRELPTVTPSIRRIGGCEWHGYLTNGNFRTC